MADSELERLRSDLTVIREAAGLELPFGWEDVWINAALGAAGVIGAVWAVLPHGLPRAWGFVPALILAVVWTAWVMGRYRRRSGRSPTRRKEYTATIALGLVMSGVMLVYRLWAQKLGLSFINMQGLSMFLLGVAMLFPAFFDRRRLYFIAYAVPMILSGIVMSWAQLPVECVFGLALMIAGPCASLVQVRQLRRSVPNHAAD